MSGTYTGERWQEARRAALSRDRVCQDCGSADDLHVHHIRPVRSFDHAEDAHYLSNLVVLCSSCHPKWEGKCRAPNLADADTGLRLSEVVRDISRQTLNRVADPPGEWILFRYFVESIEKSRRVCDNCFASLNLPRGSVEFCDECGRRPDFWSGRDSPPGTDAFIDRIRSACDLLESRGIPIHARAATCAAERLWSDDDYYGDVKKSTRLAIRVGLRKSDEPIASDFNGEIPCPAPQPIQ